MKTVYLKLEVPDNSCAEAYVPNLLHAAAREGVK